MATQNTETNKTIRAKRTDHGHGHQKYNLYIYRVLKGMNTEDATHGISRKAVNQIQNLIVITLSKMVKAVNMLMSDKAKKTIGVDEIKWATQLTLSGNLIADAQKFAAEAVRKYKESKDQKPAEGEKQISRAVRAGLIFPISRVETDMMRLSQASKRKASGAAVYLAAILEYVLSEILRQSLEVAKLEKLVRIKVRHTALGVNSHVDLSQLFSDVIFEGGVEVTSIPEAMKNKPSQRKRKSKAANPKKSAPAAKKRGVAKPKAKKAPAKAKNATTAKKAPAKAPAKGKAAPASKGKNASKQQNKRART